VEKTVRNKLESLLTSELSGNLPPSQCESLVSGGLCMALAYIQRYVKERTRHMGSADQVQQN